MRATRRQTDKPTATPQDNSNEVKLDPGHMNWLILDEALELGRQADQEHKLAKELGNCRIAV